MLGLLNVLYTGGLERPGAVRAEVLRPHEGDERGGPGAADGRLDANLAIGVPVRGVVRAVGAGRGFDGSGGERALVRAQELGSVHVGVIRAVPWYAGEVLPTVLEHARQIPQSILSDGFISSLGQIAQDVRVASVMSSERKAPAYAQSARMYVQKMQMVRIIPLATMRATSTSSPPAASSGGACASSSSARRAQTERDGRGEVGDEDEEENLQGLTHDGNLETMQRKICSTSTRSART